MLSPGCATKEIWAKFTKHFNHFVQKSSYSFMVHEMVLQTNCDGELHCCHDDCCLVLNQMPAPNVGWFTLSP